MKEVKNSIRYQENENCLVSFCDKGQNLYTYGTSSSGPVLYTAPSSRASSIDCIILAIFPSKSKAH